MTTPGSPIFHSGYALPLPPACRSCRCRRGSATRFRPCDRQQPRPTGHFISRTVQSAKPPQLPAPAAACAAAARPTGGTISGAIWGADSSPPVGAEISAPLKVNNLISYVIARRNFGAPAIEYHGWKLVIGGVASREYHPSLHQARERICRVILRSRGAHA